MTACSEPPLEHSKMKLAIETGNHALAKKLLENGADPNAVDLEPRQKSQHSLLILAISLKELEIARYLIEHGADVDTIYMNYDEDNLCVYAMTAWTTAKLIYDAEPIPSVGEIMYLIEERIKKYKGREAKRIPPENLPDEIPPQAIIDAVREGDKDSVSLLLEKNADVNTIERDSEGRSQHSVLVTAITLEKIEIAKLLIEKDAHVDTIFQNYDEDEKAVYEVSALQAAQSMENAFPKIGMGEIVDMIEKKIKSQKKRPPTVVVAHNVPIALRRRGPNVIQSSERPVPTITFEHVEDVDDIEELDQKGRNSTKTAVQSQSGPESENGAKSSKTCTIL
ncbi:uncharacterized protein [Ptychodera flava]|uniref:uncharacterized protein n=1 Tax=Ptychodera flava TaxID=63121 RepID=UPI003969E339